MGERKSTAEVRLGRSGRRSALYLAASGVLILMLACTGGTPSQDASIQQTSLALSVQATMLALQAEQPDQPGQAQPPEQPAAPTTAPPPTVAPQPPTAAPTESPFVEGSVVRAPYDPATAWGAPTKHETFDASSGYFTTGSGAAANSWYANGRYHITFTTRGWWTWYYGKASRTNFYADVVIYNGDQCVDRDSGGMLVHIQKAIDGGMMFGITCGGEYYIGITGGPGATGPVCTFNGSAFNGPSDWNCSGTPITRSSEFLVSGPGAANRLGVKATGTTYDIYLNGHYAMTFQENLSGWASGPDALFLGAGQKDLAAVSFDDYSMWKNP